MTTDVKNTGQALRISRLLQAPVELVWQVWTDPGHILNWWGPEGFTNTIYKMDVRPGGEWEFIMHGPDGTDYRNKHIFREVVPLQRLVLEHVTAPKFEMQVTFEAQGNQTLVHIHSIFESPEQLEQVIKTFGADKGLKENMDKLERYMQAQQQLRQQLKTIAMARVSTYLNFPGTTEEAFLFYKSVFGGEFTGGGITRFSEAPQAEGMPPLSDADKKLVLHVELPVLGGHVLMATDAPASMGFTVTQGNNMHINLEPDTRKETKRLFDALSAGGKVTMELQDMFWGAYFGSCTDKYGINWMFNCNEKA